MNGFSPSAYSSARFRAHSQHTTVDRDVDAVGVDAGQVEPKLDLVITADSVHPHSRVATIGGPQRPVELRERVECSKQHVPVTLQLYPQALGRGS